MSSLVPFITVFFSIIVTPFLLFFCGIVIFATLGISTGFSKLYVALLLKVFEYGRDSIEKNRQRKNSADGLEDDEEIEEDVVAELDDDKLVTTIKPSENKIANGNVISPLYSVAPSSENNINHGKPVSQCNGSCIYDKNNLDSKKSAKPKNGYLNNVNSVISRQDLILLPEPGLNNNLLHPSRVQPEQSLNTKGEFELSDVLDYIKAGVEAIIEDQVTSRFEAEELKSWNLLTRTNRNYEFINWKITVIWVIGFWFRYAFLLPLRILTLLFGVVLLTVCTAVVGYVPKGRMKRWMNERISIICFQVLSNAASCVFHYHNQENKPKNGICVANHTTPIDVLVLACDNCYSLIGQRHGGFLGLLQRALARASPHIWFERSEVKDREAVTERLRQHISDAENPPILIFPEGTCINNTSVMQFKKGSFEIGGIVYPVAIKYDPRFGDAFWNSSKYSMMQYLYMMMTSWAIVCDVWYLPPMTRLPDETAVEFANRVKREIAEQGGLVDLMWDGQLKRMKPKKEWKERQQEEFSKRLKVQ